MRRILIVAQIVALVLCIGCISDEATMADIYHAEAIAEEYPDSALTIMRGIDVDKVRTERDMMRYRLVYSEAAYYGRMYVANDSLTKPLFDYYYANHESHDKRARAMYQHAHVKQNSGKHAEAMFALIEAEKSLAHLDNPRLAGLVHRDKGDIYGAECHFQNALEEYKLAQEHFEQAGLDYHAAHTMYSIGDMLGHLHEFDKAIDYLLETETKYVALNYQALLFYAQLELCYDYIQIKDFASCEEVFSRIDKNNGIGYSYCDYYCIEAIISAYRHDFDKAAALIEMAKQEPILSDTNLSYAEYIVVALQGNNDTALVKYMAMISKQDETTLEALSNPILNYQVEALQKDIDLITEKNKRIEQQYIFTTIIALCIIAIIVGIFVYRYRQYRNRINSYINMIDGLELMRKDISQTEQMASTIERLYRQSIYDLSTLCEIYYEQGDSKRRTAKIVSEVEQSIEALKNDKLKLSELETAVNLSMDNIMKRLREQCPSLNERDMRIALYTYAGFSNRAISLLVDVNSETLPKIKYKIREYIKQSNSPDAEMLILPLTQKKC
ncbi:MAG: hypothetical protein J6C56_02360 [Alistipes sp.]|nr:hypothetical protein [Alistipes sp.]